MPTIRVPAFAKVNLRLHILGQRPDGYHELRTIFQAISLHDTLELTLVRRPGIELQTDDPVLLTGPDNLVWRALNLLRRELRLRHGVHAFLRKQIPVGRGLGGGSSDAAAALIGLLRLTGRKVPAARLLQLASTLGADVPFFLQGGRALGVGRGDEIYPLPDLPRRAVLVLSPANISVSTREAYSWLKSPQSSAKRSLTKRAATSRIWSFCALCWSTQGAGLENDFEAPVFRRHPRLSRLKRELLRQGAAEAALAGSGSAVFGVFPNPAQARRAARAFSQDRVFTVTTLSRKEYLRALDWQGAI